MKKSVFILVVAVMLALKGYTQNDTVNVQFLIDSIEKSLVYERGTIELKNGVGKITIPPGFKYLNAEQSEKVLVDLWGNPKEKDISLGMILPEHQGVLGDSGYVFNIEYDEIGYVKDDDADDINYDELLQQMRTDAVENNKIRKQQGFDPISVVGWAAKPFYDEDRKILHWAKELKFGDQEVNTLNYNIRVLGRRGVLILNAIGTMPNLPLVQKDLKNVLNIVQFNEGYKYENFNPSTDQVAAWTIGGLVAGKVLSKVGFFAVILKYWKIIALAVGGSLGAFWKKIFRRREDKLDEAAREMTEKKRLS